MPTNKKPYAYVPVPLDFLKEVDIGAAQLGYNTRQKYLKDLAKKLRQDNARMKNVEEKSRKFIDFTW